MTIQRGSLSLWRGYSFSLVHRIIYLRRGREPSLFSQYCSFLGFMILVQVSTQIVYRNKDQDTVEMILLGKSYNSGTFGTVQWFSMDILEPGCLGLDLGFATYQLCNLVILLLCASFSAIKWGQLYYLIGFLGGITKLKLCKVFRKGPSMQ